MDSLLITLSLLALGAPAITVASYGTWLSVYDIRHHRLPNKHVLAMTLIVLAFEIFLCLAASQWSPFISALRVALTLLAIYGTLFLISRGQLGMGDVKYSVPTGLALGFYSPHGAINCVTLTFVLAGIVSLIGMLTKRLTRESRMAFGPYMTIATVAIIAISAPN